MMVPYWLIIVSAGHILNACAFIIDKYLLTQSIPKPRLYSFYIGMLGALALVLIPFGVHMLPFGLLLISLVSGALFVLALYAFFVALKQGEASRIPVIVGSLSPVLIFLLSRQYLHELLNTKQIVALVLIIGGGLLISFTKGKGWKLKGFGMSLLAALLFSASYTTAKYVFNGTDFLSGFVWMRVGGVLMALTYYMFASTRLALAHPSESKKKGTPLIFLMGQILGALGFVLINYSLSLTSPTLVNALQSLQYAFLFCVTIFLSLVYPRILKEKITLPIFLQKTIALGIIGVGIIVLT